VTSIDDSVHPDGKLSATRSFSHDSLYRLTHVQGPAGPASYAYDVVGNLLQKSDVGAYAYGGPRPNAVQAVGGRPFTYDANGAVTSSFGRTFEYDARGELRLVKSADAVTEYLYDYEGHRVVKKVTQGAVTKKVVYLDRFAEERDGQLVKYVFAGDVRLARIGGGTPRAVQSATSFLRHTTSGLSLLGLLAVALGAALGRVRHARHLARRVLAVGLALAVASCQCGPGPNSPLDGTVFYLADHLGSSEVLLDSSGKVVAEASYDAWGLQVAATDEPHSFTGKEWDAEAGLYYFGSRYYDPRLGRFLSVDPAALGAPEKSLEDPQSLNPYSYARNTPTSLKDRDGKLPHILVGALAGAAINTGIYLVKGAINGEDYSWRGALAAAASGAVSGAVAAATGGAGLLVSGAASSAAGGVLQRGIETGSVSAALDPGAMALDVAVGAGSAALAKVGAAAVKKVVGGVKGRMGKVAAEAAEGCGAACDNGGCFVAGTPVTLASGEQVPIESIQVGDWVAAPPSLDHPHALRAFRVTETPRRTVAEVLDVTVEHEGGRAETFTTTGEHPFARLGPHGPEWLPAERLAAGDLLLTGNSTGRVLEVHSRIRPTAVFNLEVDSAHAYLVGSGRVLVHNNACKVGGGAKETERVRHFTNAKGAKGIEVDQTIKASDQNNVFTVRAKGKPGSPRDVEEALGIKRGRGNNYIEFDAKPDEFKITKNPITGTTERVFMGDVNLAGRNATFHKNR
jgi:RHS repeat-associated protein